MVEKVLKFKELKDEFIVRYYMCEADRCKSRGAFFETFLNLNKALACVMPGVSVSIVMQLRSELYDLLQMPRESLQSLQWAESHDASVDLTERKVACEVAIASDVIPPDATLALRLTHTPNPTIPYISSCLKLRTSVKFGNHVFTGRNLAIGDVICIEKPLFGGMYAEDGSANHEKDSHFQRCFHCFSYSNMNLFPCENCNFVLFCSLMCQQEAHNIYHKYECSINMKLHGVQHIVLSMRSFFFALYLHNGSIAELRAAIEARAGAPPMTIFDCDARDPESLERARNLMYVFHSYKAEPRATKNNVFAMIFRLLPELSVMWQGNEDFILTFLARHINNSRELEQELTQWPGNTPDIFGQMTSPQPNACDNYFIRKVVGHAYYPFVGLLNHSCVENVHRHIDQHLKTILIVSRPIKAGQQLFLNYNGDLSYSRLPRTERMQLLSKKHMFRCTCIACTSNAFPILQQLVIRDPLMCEFAMDGALGIFIMPRKDLFSSYASLLEQMQHNFTLLPTKEQFYLHYYTFLTLALTTLPTFTF